MNKRKGINNQNSRPPKSAYNIHADEDSQNAQGLDTEQTSLLPSNNENDTIENLEHTQKQEQDEDQGYESIQNSTMPPFALIGYLKNIQKSPYFYYGFGVFVHIMYPMLSFIILNVIWLSYKEGECPVAE